jgi:hypothetical protein
MAPLILNFGIKWKCVGFTTVVALLPGKELTVSFGWISRASLDIVGTKMFCHCWESKHDWSAVQSVVKHFNESATMDLTVLLSFHSKQPPKTIKFFHGIIEQFLLQNPPQMV